MSPFNFGKNFLEEQFLVIDNLENRIIRQELTLEELVEQLKILVKSNCSQESLRAVQDKINQLDIPKDIQAYIQQVLLQLYETSIINTMAIDNSISQEPTHSVHNNNVDSSNSETTIQVYDEWTDSDRDNLYDTGEWYEGISFNTKIEEKNINNDSIRLVEDIQEEQQDISERSILAPSFEGISIVLADPNIAEEFNILKFETSSTLLEDTYPYDYVASIIKQVQSIPEKKEDIDEEPKPIVSLNDVKDLSFALQNPQEEEIASHIDEISQPQETIPQNIQPDNSIFITPEELEELMSPSLIMEEENPEPNDIRDTLDLFGEEDSDNNSLKAFDQAKDFNTPVILEKKSQDHNTKELLSESMTLEESNLETLDIQEQVISEIQDDSLESQKEVLEEVNIHHLELLETKEKETIKDSANPIDKKLVYWWMDYPPLEYTEKEDFGAFILYRDLG